MLFSNLRQRLAHTPERLSSACRDNLDYRAGLIEKLIGSQVSRRDVLRLSLTATLGAPIFGPLARAASRFEIQANAPQHVAILVANEVLFEVRARDFGLDARIDFQQTSPDEFGIRLHNGWLPGTRLAADFELRVARGNNGWQAGLVWPALGYTALFDFEPWLLGFPVASGALDASRLFSGLDLVGVTTTSASAVFLPDWTFEISLAPAAQISLTPGTVTAANLQLELVGADAPMLLVDGSTLRTRLWFEGPLLGATPVQLAHCQAVFANGQVEAVVECRADAPMAWAMEAYGGARDTGFITPHTLANSQMAGFGTQQLRLVSLDAEQCQAQATLRTQSCWYEASGIHIEVSVSSTSLQACSQLDLAQVDTFRVTRMIVAMPDVDQAVFVRMSRPDGGATEVDQLAWFDGVHLLGRSVPLDEFELHLTRGSDALQVIVRFHDVRLKVTDSSRQLLCAGKARLEFAFASQHVSEQSLYVTQLPDAAGVGDHFIADDQICQLLSPQGPSCKQWLAEMRAMGLYDTKRKEAIALRASQGEKRLFQPTAARFADASWLTFNFSRNGKLRRVPLTLEALFGWTAKGAKPAATDLFPILHPLALPANVSLEEQQQRCGLDTRPARSLRQAMGKELEEFATMIQAPYRLGLSPIGNHRWQAPAQVDEAPGRRELWTLRIERTALRAFWSPDYQKGFWPTDYPHFPQPGGSFRAPLDGRDRHEIVALSSVFGETAKLGTAQVVPYAFGKGQRPDPKKGLFVPRPIQAQLLQLSAYGASLRLKANWAPPSSTDDKGALTIAFWDQKSQLGRDTFGVVEYKGFLFPLGLPATLVKDTQRRLVFIDGGYCACLVQRFYIKVPALSRPTPMLQQPFGGRGWPFASIRCDDYLSPDLAAPEQCSLQGLAELNGQQVFWPSVMTDANATLPVDFAFEDPVTGVKARAPLLFIDNDVAHHKINLAKVARAYRKGVDAIYARGDGDNASLRDESGTSTPRHFIARIDSGAIRFAPEIKPGSTRFKASCLLLDFDVPGPPPLNSDFDAEPSDGNDKLAEVLCFSTSMEAQDQPPFYPHLRQALANAGSVMRLAGTPTVESRVEIYGPYLRHGFDAGNVGEIYLRFVDDRTKLAFSSNTTSSGGFANASTVIAAASRKDGPIGGAGPLVPQREFYRHEPPGGPQILSTFTSSNGTIADPVANARKGTADPREFFGQTLGEAKLCGVVAFADIIDSVAQAAGARAPQIREALEHAVSPDLLAPIASTLRKALKRLLNALAELSAKGLHAPALLAAARALDGKLAEVPDVTGVRLLQLTSEIVKAGETLRDQVSTAIESPANLLPPEVLERVEALKALSKNWQGFLKDGPIQKIKDQLLDGLGVTKAVQELAALKVTLEETVKKDSRYKGLAARVEQLQAAFAALEQASRQAPQEFLATLLEKLQPLLDGLENFAGWSSWLTINSQDVQNKLTNLAKQLLKDVLDSPTALLDNAQSLKRQADTFKQALANHGPAADQAILQVSEISLAAIAHAEAVQATLELYRKGGAEEVSQRIMAELLTGALRFSQETLGKVSRLLELERKLDNIQPGLASNYLAAYLTWTRAIVTYSQLSSVLEHVAELSQPVASINQRCDQVKQLLRDLDSANKLADLAQQLRPLDAFAQLNELIIAALQPQQAIRAALGQFHNLAEEQLTAALGPVCTALKIVINGVGILANPDLSPTPTWFSPALRTQINELRILLQKLSKNPAQTRDAVRTYLADFDQARVQLTTLVEDVSRMLSTGNLSALVDIQGALDEALASIGLPTKARLNYDWDTRVNPYPAGSNPIFEPIGEGRLTVSSLLEADLRGNTPPVFSLSASLDPFAINLFGAAPFLSIVFKPLSFSAGTGREAKLEVNIDHVDFKGALTFVKTLQEYLKEKLGIIVEPRKAGPGLVAGYSFSKDLITLAAFQLQMVSFNITCELPFDNEPARFRFSLSRPDQPFLISAGIYSGGGHVAIQSRADTLEALDASFEYGVVTAFQFGPAVGRGRITAGIYIRLSAREATLSGYFNASGVANIAGLITVSAQFRVQLWYDLKSGRTAGAATFSISFSIGFFDYEYDVSVAYASQGDKPGADKGSRVSASLLPLPAIAAAAQLDQEQKQTSEEAKLAVLKNKIASGIEPSSFKHDSDCLLDPPVWQAYWAAFEDPTDGCA